VEADPLGYKIGKVTVSDFVLPGWFEPTHVGKNEKLAFKSKVTKPFQLLQGGYISYFDLNGGGWQQLTAQKGPSDARNMSAQTSPAAPWTARPRVGSRRERRRLPKNQWLTSTAS